LKESLPITAAVLAAGTSTRMGKPKQLLPIAGTPMLQVVIDKLLSFPFERVLAVVGHCAEEIRAAIDPPDSRFCWIMNENYRNGLSASLIEAVKACSDDSTAGLLIVLGDQPLLRKQTIGRIQEIIHQLGPEASRSVIQTVCQGRPGHPVFIPSSLFPQIYRLTGDRGAKHLFPLAERKIVVEVEDGGVTFDVDTYDDYLQVKDGARASGRERIALDSNGKVWQLDGATVDDLRVLLGRATE
jgi:molybdenum cofactor cytidylyltransferase